MIAERLKRIITYSFVAFLFFSLVLAGLLMKNLKNAFEVQYKEYATNVAKTLEFEFSKNTKEIQRTFNNFKNILEKFPITNENLPELKASLISNLRALDVSLIAFYDKNSLVHIELLSTSISIRESRLKNLSLNILTGKTHFFLANSEFLFPVEIVVLYPSTKILELWDIRAPSVIAALKFWTISEIIKLEELTGSSIRYSSEPGKSEFTKLVYSHELKDEFGRRTGYLVFSKNFSLLRNYVAYVVVLLLSSMVVLITILLIFYLKLKHLTLAPFSDIIYAINNHTPDTVEQYIHRQDEIGSLANAIKNYLHQREQINLYLKDLENKNLSLKALNEQVRQMLEKDMLTGLLTRFVFNSQIERLYVSSKADRIPLSAIYIDADNFKKVNDTYGHNVGDEVLKGIADVILKNVRASDFPIRMGGEEILILLPEADVNAAYTIAERIRTKVEEKFKEKPYKVTISLGVSQLKGEDTIESFLKRCDEALYTSKENGKNRTTVL